LRLELYKKPEHAMSGINEFNFMKSNAGLARNSVLVHSFPESDMWVSTSYLASRTFKPFFILVDGWVWRHDNGRVKESCRDHRVGGGKMNRIATQNGRK